MNEVHLLKRLGRPSRTLHFCYSPPIIGPCTYPFKNEAEREAAILRGKDYPQPTVVHVKPSPANDGAFLVEVKNRFTRNSTNRFTHAVLVYSGGGWLSWAWSKSAELAERGAVQARKLYVQVTVVPVFTDIFE